MFVKVGSFLSVLLIASPLAFATIVVPNAQATTEGNSSFSIFGDTNQRTQEAFEASQFSGPIWINEILFRTNAGAGSAFSPNTTHLTVSLAYSTVLYADDLQNTYASNIWYGSTVVYNDDITWSSPGCSAPGPCPFDLVIPLTTSFHYIPSGAGNTSGVALLLDMTNGLYFPNGTFDAQSGISESVALVTGSSGSTTGSFFTNGMVVEFEGSSDGVPEPATWTLLLAGLAGTLFVHRRR